MDEKPLRVLQICHDFKGPFRVIARLYANAFADCDVTTIFLRGFDSAEISESIGGTVHFLGLEEGELKGLKLNLVRQVKELIESNPPDLVIAHRYKPLFIATLINRSLEIPVILGVMHEYGLLSRWTRAVYSRFWPENVHLIGVSEPVADEIASRHAHLVNRLHVVPHALETTHGFDPVSARHELGIPIGRYCYGTIGRLVPKKNQRVLIDAFAKLDDDSILAIVGEGELESELSGQVRSLGLKDRVIFCGQRDDAKRYLKAFDVFVLTSTDREAFGMVLLEAMQAEIPVVSSDAPGPKSVLDDTALMFKAGDAEALCERLRQIRTMTREELGSQTKRAFSRLNSEYSVAVMKQKLRNLPPVKALLMRHE